MCAPFFRRQVPLERRLYFGTAIPHNITNWELHQVWNNFRDKATFYWKSKLIDLTEVLEQPEDADG